MARRLDISRRDFLGGLALGTAAGALAPVEALARSTPAGGYPPAIMGMRGSQPGSFDVAHAVAWGGQRYPRPSEQTDGMYDLVVVGGGISGLAAAHFYREQAAAGSRMLVLDNHDDFGGHARRNEFTVDGRQLIGYGGSQSLDTPGSYSREAAGLLRALSIDPERFYDYYDQDFHASAGLGRGVYFGAGRYGEDRVLPELDLYGGPSARAGNAALLARYPLDDAARRDCLALLSEPGNPLAAMPRDARIAALRGMSYRQFLLDTVGVPEAVYLLWRDSIRGWWGVGWDAISALEAQRMGMPGTRHVDLPPVPQREPERNEPYIFHFPDGNAGVARALVRSLIPGAVPGSSMEDLVLARVDYAALDQAGQRCRLRLNSTAVDVRHTPAGDAVDVCYVRDGRVERVRAKHVVMACYNAMLPHICPEMPEDQCEAIAYATKVPLVYMSIAVRNWRPFAELGMHSLSVPQSSLMHAFGLDFPVSMGAYRFADTPDQPTVLHGSWVPTVPDRGLTARQQHEAGRRQIYETTWEQFESGIIEQLTGALGGAGFDPARDIAGLTVNRWPHGYAYEYNELSDPAHYGPDEGPHRLGARQMGRISVANSDASAYAFVDGAIDAAWRATREQLG
ncbi:NAD(P)/FAD-dependent oxidoreductase [Chromatocurvus halotolerans]|uniref:Spermidine dehydrogenase n=1 Tax=Chromatocurvus halotolerans TaxID=1132028 RepID=A0A4R2KSC6_9GAMM|nr:NAD(P)/FAD-dependent oxidoreductase [Chromatocurvus halotolerans]TCO76683.1 spermidine dehydrogenase [Chromatocurvus halotolerans]